MERERERARETQAGRDGSRKGGEMRDHNDRDSWSLKGKSAAQASDVHIWSCVYAVCHVLPCPPEACCNTAFTYA